MGRLGASPDSQKTPKGRFRFGTPESTCEHTDTSVKTRRGRIRAEKKEREACGKQKRTNRRKRRRKAQCKGAPVKPRWVVLL